MSIEIERKFLVKASFKEFSKSSVYIVQAYLSIGPKCSIRVRICGDKAYLTIKGETSASGLSRYEWERELTVDEARDLIKLSEFEAIEKTRYFIPQGKHCYEVDVFEGKNSGLIVAELELESEEETYEKPSWLGAEVTGDIRYYNANLQINSYSEWKDDV
jgi:CYTH domain-containing protein